MVAEHVRGFTNVVLVLFFDHLHLIKFNARATYHKNENNRGRKSCQNALKRNQAQMKETG